MYPKPTANGNLLNDDATLNPKNDQVDITTFPGLPVDGRPTTVTKFTPAQLAKSNMFPSFYRLVNNAVGKTSSSSPNDGDASKMFVCEPSLY